MNDIHFAGVWRMDWGLGNPNKTAALIATLLVSIWFLAYVRKWGFWVALVCFTGLGVCLFHTFSRGGVVGALVGLIFVAWKLPRPWPVNRTTAVIISVVLVLGSAVFLRAHQRFGQGLAEEDRSITNRLVLWKVTPQMMIAAPGGWGIGKSGDAFMQWFQPVNHNEVYRTLVNSHLTWLVELGWPLRFLYLLGWLAVFVLCWPTDNQRWLAIPFGVWAAFAVTATFSSVAESPWLWILPTLNLVAVLVFRIVRKVWPRPRSWLIPVGAAAFLCLGLFLVGRQERGIYYSKNLLTWGGDPKIYILLDKKVVGSLYGKAIRRYHLSPMGRDKPLAVVESTAVNIDCKGKTIVISGSIADWEKKNVIAMCADAEKIVLLNPGFLPQEVGLSHESASKVTAIFGEFSRSQIDTAWEGFAVVRRLKGAGDFLPAWPELL